jgi:hypothetical protein
MKVFVATLTVAAALVLGWHYWVVLRPKPLPEPAPTQGVYRAVGPGASARSVPSGPHSALNVIVSLAGGGTHSAHVELIRFTQQGRPFS